MLINTERDARVAAALQIRLRRIQDEMESALAQRDNAYRMADGFLIEFDELAKTRHRLTRALWLVEQRLSEAAFDRRGREVAA